MSRRRFALSLAAAASLASAPAARIVAAMSDSATTTASSEPAAIDRAAWIERSIGRSLAPDVRKTVNEQLDQSAASWARVRAAYAVPDGTEPGFVFVPVTAKARS